MATIAEIRQRYPQYSDMTDQQLGDALHKKFYSDMPRDQFDQKIGLGPQPGTSMIDKASTAVGGLIEGIPVVGPMIRGGVERAAAATVAPFSDRTYDQILSDYQKDSERDKAANPMLNTGAQIAGGIAGTIPMVMAAPAAFGVGAGSLGVRSAASALTSAGLGTADAGVRSGGDPEAMKSGAAWGGGLGLVAPGVGQAVGKGINALVNRSAAPSAAQQTLGRAAMSDAVDPATVTQRLTDLGPEAMVMDLGPNLQRQAGALAATPGRGQEVVRSAIGARDAGANARIRGDLDATIGPAPVPSRIETQIKSNMDALGPEYTAAFAKARKVDTTPIANFLDTQAINLRGEAQKAAQSVRKMLNVAGTDALDPNPHTLFQTRNAIDGMLATEANPKAIGLLTEARKQIDNRLAGSVPGIKKVDAKFAELARQNDALTRGQQTLDSGRTSLRPDELAAEFQSGALPQGAMIGPSAVPMRMSQGARAEIDRIVGTNANDRVALQKIIKGEGDWNRARLATLFGQDKADRMLSVLDRERAFADTSHIVTRNSETAARAAAMGEVAPTESGPGIMRSVLNLKAGDAAAGLGDKVISAARAATQGRTNEELAQLLTSGARNSQTITQAIKAVQTAARRGQIAQDQAQKLIQAVTVGGAPDRSRGVPAPASIQGR